MKQINSSKHPFILRLSPSTDNCQWGFSLYENIGENSLRIVQIKPEQTYLYKRTVLQATTASGHQPHTLSTRRRAPLPLTQPAGTRLALTMLASHPVSKPSRKQRIADAISSFSEEETLYWYALATSSNKKQALKALRLLLVDTEAA